MGSDRNDLHRLVDELDEQLLNDAAALLRTLKPTSRCTAPAAAPAADERCLRQQPERHGHSIGRNSVAGTRRPGSAPQVIVDTGVVYADIDRADDWHASAAELLSTAPGPLRLSALVVTEVCYLLETRLGPVASALSMRP